MRMHEVVGYLDLAVAEQVDDDLDAVLVIDDEREQVLVTQPRGGES